VNGLAAIFYRDWRQRITNLGFVFWDLFVPVAYLLLFGLGFERTFGEQFAINGAKIPYADFFLAGVLAMTTFGIALNTSWGFFMDKDSGIFYELLTYPITRRQFLFGKILFNVLLSATGALLAILLGALALDVSIRWLWLPVTILVVMCTTAGWFFFLSVPAIRFDRMDSFNTFNSAAYILLMFLSTMFYPIDSLPTWFRTIAWLNPMTWQVDVLRYSLLGIGSTTVVLVEFACFMAFTFICLSLAVRTIDRVG
jgi:ABC-2 type transport system permease protein